MCDFVDKRLETIRKYKDIIMMFGGAGAAVCIYMDGGPGTSGNFGQDC